jgi:hypothetical protein
MKQFIILLLAGLGILSSCKRGDPVIANPDELAVATLSENLICQPVTNADNMVAAINKNGQAFLCKYNANGEKIWQDNIDNYTIESVLIKDVEDINLIKDNQNNLLLTLLAPKKDQNQKIISENIREVKFSQNGDFIWQAIDSIHQPIKIQIGPTPVNMANKGLSMAIGFVCFSGGEYGVISSLIDNLTDSTFIQLTTYDSDANTEVDNYFKIPGKRNIKNVYSTPGDQLLFSTSIEGTSDSYFLYTDINGHVINDELAPGPIIEMFFLDEISTGNYLASYSFTNRDNKLRGVICSFDNTGHSSLTHIFDLDPSWVMMSVKQLSDGYLFSGFDSDELMLGGVDWRTSFIVDSHQAVILKTDFAGNEIWHRTMNASFYSAGAAVIGNNPISFFGGRYEASGNNIFIIKLTNQGDVIN